MVIKINRSYTEGFAIELVPPSI
ncbi:hypothetical protein AERO8C_150228 [Aeromonas veronii]|uniref:Uncharacterized protein n=1 Tax=Aeromonas veronii TaxID=654 RepID=A0A653KW52_AERVE|nr:hypothetical protein AERO8C_150228 [Aeromonas veronii]